MTMWLRIDPKKLLVEVLGFAKTEKTALTLNAALHGYSKAKGIRFPALVKLWSKKILEELDGEKLINTLTVTDAKKLFEKLLEEENQSTAYRTRATLINSIRYAYTGQLPESERAYAASMEVKAPEPSNGEVDIGRLKFSVARLDQVVHLVPLYSATGRFGWVKAEVQKMVFSLKDGESGIIEAPKRAMTAKEAKALIFAVLAMFTRGKLPWTIRYNPQETTFIILRKSDFEKIVNKNKKRGVT